MTVVSYVVVSYVVFCDKKYMLSWLTFQMCDRIANYGFSDRFANYGFSVSIQSNRRSVNSSVLHSTVNTFGAIYDFVFTIN